MHYLLEILGLAFVIAVFAMLLPGGGPFEWILDWMARKTGLQGIPGKPTKGGTGVEGLLTREAVVMENFMSSEDGLVGRVQCDGATWNATADHSGPILKGQYVKVVAARGLTLVIVPRKDAV